jgi:hypothetical protein
MRTTPRAAIASLLLSAVLLASAASALGVGTASATQTAAEDDAPTIDVRYEIQRVPERQGVVRVTAVVTVPRPVRNLTVELPTGARHVSHAGFEIAAKGLRWDGATRTATVTYTAPVGVTTAFGQRTADAATWTLVTRGEVGLSARWQWRGERDPAWDERLVVPGRGVGSPSVAYLGAHRRHRLHTEGGVVRLVVPATASLRAPPADILDSVAGARREIAAGQRHDVVTFFVAPSTLGPGGYTPANGEPAATINAAEPVASPTNVWVHEYRHMHQSYRTTEAMRWLKEGSADYYAAAITLRQGRISYDRYRTRITTVRHENASLVSPETWASPNVPYDKGARVVAALDVRIQRETAWQRSFADVLRVLAVQDRPITVAVFAEAVSTVAGEDLDAVVERALTGPAPAVPDAPHALTLSGTDDHDGDGLDNAGEWRYGTHPFRADTDGDGREDGAELDAGTDPLLDDPRTEDGGDQRGEIRPRRTPARYESPAIREGVAVDTEAPPNYAVASPGRLTESRGSPASEPALPESVWASGAVLVLALGLWWRLRDVE